MQGKRVLTVEEAKALPPPTEEELARRRAVLAEVRKEVDAFLAAGGRLPTAEEWQDTWEAVHYGDEDDD